MKLVQNVVMTKIQKDHTSIVNCTIDNPKLRADFRYIVSLMEDRYLTLL